MRDELRKLGGGGAVHLAWKGPVATLTLDNPGSRNALTPRMIAQLADHVDALEESEGIGLVLRGAGPKAFCAGADLAFVEQARARPELAVGMCRLMHAVTRRLGALPLVSVAAIEGGAWGGGAELATATDFRLLSRTATLHFVHARLGLAPGWGGGVRLPRLVGRQAALRLLCASEPASAQKALALGLADGLAPAGGAQAAAEALLAPMAALDAASVRACKRVVGVAEEDAAYAAAEAAFSSLW